MNDAPLLSKDYPSPHDSRHHENGKSDGQGILQETPHRSPMPHVMFLQENDVDSTGRLNSEQRSIGAAPFSEALDPGRGLVHTPLSLSPMASSVQLASATRQDGLPSASHAHGGAPLNEKGETLPATAQTAREHGTDRSNSRLQGPVDEGFVEKPGESSHLALSTARKDSIVPDGSSKRLYQLTKRFSAARNFKIG